jgi:hypothetical protein
MNRKCCGAASEMVRWKTGLSYRSCTAIIGKQVNFGLEISMNDTNYLISSQHLVQNEYIMLILFCVIQTYFRPKLNWSHRTFVRPKLKVIGHFVRWPCKRYFKACLSSSERTNCLHGWWNIVALGKVTNVRYSAQNEANEQIDYID